MHVIATAPIDVKPKFWKRYKDDILELVKKENADALTDHLNQTDATGSIKFIDERENDGHLPCLDVLIVRKDNGTIKLLVYRKSSHTDQYLNFHSHHPFHHKLGVIRTLMERCHNIVTEEEDKTIERRHITEALERCGYPSWTFTKVKHQMERSQWDKKSREERKAIRIGLVVIPFVKGV
ncbi:hypothetical protein HOLleu_35531 [Holothuria leucospilota]|uniref:Helix-turn-helix domain-containing protein n=1 Tax=Holothuria leucospilota TaxID=206669 RepID=A0A9Q0YIM4_HOLLE|nr:hypothetical protein HOLleu_35531 [Holothuria leucospilota]